MTTTLGLIFFAALFSILAWRHLVAAAAVVLFLLPSYQLRFSLWGIPMTVLELMILLLCVVWILQRALFWNGRSMYTFPWRWSILLFLVSAVVSIYVSPDRLSALGYFKAYILEPILFFAILWDRISSERHVRVLLASLGAGALFLSLIAFLQYLDILPALEPWVSETPKRVSSLFAFPNALGLYLSPVIALFLAFFLLPAHSRGRRRQNLFPLAIVLAASCSLVFTVSRGGIIAIGAVLLFLSFVSPYRKWVLGAIAVAIAIVLVLPPTRMMLAGIASGADVSTDVRFVLWQGTARMLIDRPIVGVGLGGFQLLYEEYKLAKHTEILLYPHNIILNMWVELGLAGAAIFCWFLIDAFRKLSRVLHNDLSPFGRQLAFALCAAILAIIVHGIVDVPYLKNDLAVEFWFLLALVPVVGRLHPQKTAAQRGERSTHS
jgi:putative inorganic carbon (HCO3(-)) transporter